MKNKLSVRKHARLCTRLVWAAFALTLGGCSFSGEPRPRLGSYATSTPGTTFIDLTNLGGHQYSGGLFEKNGILYTCDGGHIDIAHLRIGADYVRYHYLRTRKLLMKTDRRFGFKLNVDPSQYHVTLTYPENWKRLSDEEQEQIADEVAMELAQHFTFMMVTWHEVMTFVGYKSMGVVPEFPSAFSWEDNYSNLMGIRLGAAAIRDADTNYDAALTRLLNEELERLGIRSAAEAKAAAEAMRGIWFDGNIIVTMKVRHMDLGLDDGMMTPLLATGVCEGTPRSIPTPTLEAFNRHGFRMTLQVEPREFEKGEILRLFCPGGGCTRINLPDDLPTIMDYLEKRANQLGCAVVK
jgi:hypothetical protein